MPDPFSFLSIGRRSYRERYKGEAAKGNGRYLRVTCLLKISSQYPT